MECSEDGIKTIGLTGGIAVGKSTVSDMLKAKGMFIIDADKIAHDVLYDASVKAELCDCFGREILDANGEIDRRLLAQAAFKDDESTNKLNALTHPAIKSRMEQTIDQARGLLTAPPAVVIDAPLLIESGLHRICDSVVLICANIQTRYARIMERDGLTREQAKKRIAAQMPQWKKKRYADFIINNDASRQELRSAVDDVLDKLGILQ